MHKKKEEEGKGKEDGEGTTDHLPLNTRSFAFKIKKNKFKKGKLTIILIKCYHSKNSMKSEHGQSDIH